MSAAGAQKTQDLIFDPLTANGAHDCDRQQEDVRRNDQPNNRVKGAVHDYSTQFGWIQPMPRWNGSLKERVNLP